MHCIALHVPVFVRTSIETGGWVTVVEQDFLCSFIVHKRSFFFCAGKGESA